MKPCLENTIECAVDLFKSYSGRICVITGAGISSDQLPTFRSNSHSGLWDVLKFPILSKSNFYSNPLPSWRLAANVRNLQVRGELKPTVAHCILHEMLKRGIINGILTQNIDSLHCFKGDEKKVIELHGAVTNYGVCETCHANRLVDQLKILEQKVCPKCSVCGATLKPPVAFFEDPIPASVRSAANATLSSSDVLILVGTHCAVDPVLSMTETAKKNGTILVEVNTETTVASGFMDMTLKGTCNSIFEAISKQLMKGFDPKSVIGEFSPRL